MTFIVHPNKANDLNINISELASFVEELLIKNIYSINNLVRIMWITVKL